MKDYKDCRCDAIKKNGKRCTCMSKSKIPNTVSGTGAGVYDWKYGKPVRLCRIHFRKYYCSKDHVMKVHGGVLQPYNQYGYGSVVLTKLTDWNTNPKALKAPKSWYYSEEKCN